MKSIFRRSIEPRIVEKLGTLHRQYISLKLEGIYESALAPLIEAELRRHPGAYIKSHPRGTREGKSRIELDVAVVNVEREMAEESAAGIVRDLRSQVETAGATVISQRRTAP